MSRVKVPPLEIDNIDMETLLDEILRMAVAPSLGVVNYANAHACNLAARDSEFHRVMHRAERVFCDGQGVILGARILGTPIQERMTPPDWIDKLYSRCEEKKLRVYFIGETPEVVEAYAAKVRIDHPALDIAGRWDGFFKFGSPEEENLVSQLQSTRPHVILTGMGMPKQERWADRMRERLPGGVVLATGALFRWGSGVETRRRTWWTDSGFEWLLRLLRHPLRHFRRYVLGNPLFIARIIRHRFGWSS